MWKPCTIVISNTIAHGNSRKEMKQKKNIKKKSKKERTSKGEKWAQKKLFQRPSYRSGLPSSAVASP